MTLKSELGILKNDSPLHVAVIMDGNGRWAKSKGYPRSFGHKQGASVLERLLQACKNEKISYVTVYAFSAENWNRSHEEVDSLMTLLGYYLDTKIDKLVSEGINLKILGDIARLPVEVVNKIDKATKATKDNNELYFNIAISYGSQQEIANAVKSITKDVIDNKLNINNINEELIEKYLYTSGIPKPDLLIRTGGEKRLSNFLLWQLAYTELVFLDVLWPDFNEHHLKMAIGEFRTRERRYGTCN